MLSFIIPTNFENLQTVTGEQYEVKEILGPTSVIKALKIAAADLQKNGAFFIFEHFDTYYSVLEKDNRTKLHADVIRRAYEDLYKGMVALNKAVHEVLEDIENLVDEVKDRFREVIKMLLYIFSQFVMYFAGQQLGKTFKKGEDSGSLNRPEVIRVLNDLFGHENLNQFWRNPPIVEDSLLGLASEIGLMFLGDPAAGAFRTDLDFRTNLFALFVILIGTHKCSESLVVRLVLLIKSHEHVGPLVSDIMKKMRQMHNQCQGIVKKLVYEATDWVTNNQRYSDSVAARLCSLFITDLGVKLPAEMMVELPHLTDLLFFESSMIRAAVMNVITEIIDQLLSGANLEVAKQVQRDELLSLLIEHLNDTNAMVRSRVIQNLSRLRESNKVPLRRQNDVLAAVLRHLKDRGSLVRKAAIECAGVFLSFNTYSGDLREAYISKLLMDDRTKMEKLLEKYTAARDKHDAEVKKEWESIKGDLKKAFEEFEEDDDDDVDDDDDDDDDGGGDVDDNENCAENEDGEENTNEDEVKKIEIIKFRDCLRGGHFQKAIKILKKNTKDFPEWQQSLGESDEIEKYLILSESIFLDMTNEMRLRRESILSSQELSEIESLQNNIDYLQNTMNFLKLIGSSLDTMKQLLTTTNVTDMNAAIDFLIKAHRFRIEHSLEGIFEILKLIKNKEQVRKEAAIKAMKCVYLMSASTNMIDHKSTVVEGLLHLVRNITLIDFDNLETLIAEWAEKGMLDNSLIDALWHIVTKPRTHDNDGDKRDEARAAIEILRMASMGRNTIITKNFKLMCKITFEEPESMLFMSSCLRFLAVPGHNLIDMFVEEPPVRLKNNEVVFIKLLDVLVENFFKPCKFYPRALEDGIDFIYRMCSKPSELVEAFLKRIVERLRMCKTFRMYQISRLCCLVGVVSLKVLGFLDDIVYRELKRRHNMRAAKMEKNDNLSELEDASRKSDKSSASMARKSNLSCVSQVNTSTASNAKSESQKVASTEAIDSDAEFILNVLENDIVTGTGVLGKLATCVITVCQRPDQYPGLDLQGTAVIAFIRTLCLSSQMCVKHIRTLYTILERTEFDEVKRSIVLQSSDLLSRMPNMVEPWFYNVYQRLRDPNPEVRCATFYALGSLVLRDLVRPTNYISTLAACLVDPDPTLNTMCRTFFEKLSHKENNFVSLVPEVFSYLDRDQHLNTEQFREILKFLMNLMNKSKRLDSLVDRLCSKFTTLESDMQKHRNIVFCLTLVVYNDKALLNLQNKFPLYKHLVHDEEIYGHLMQILDKCNKPPAPKKIDLRSIATELIKSIESVFEMNENGEKPPPKPQIKTTKRRQKIPAKNKKTRKAVDSDSLSE